MTQDPELVVIIILNLNKKEEILKCLEDVFKLDYSPYEVVVIDNGSTDGSADAISKAFSEVHLIRSINNLGVSGGRNLGIEYANNNFRYKYLFFLDNDTLVEDSSLTKLTEALKNDKEAGLAFPKAYREFPSKIIMSVGIYVNLYIGSIYDIGAGEIDQGQYNLPRHVLACGAFGFLAKKEVFSQIGWFDEIFNPYGWEDVDFSLRTRKEGFKILYIPEALIYHKGGKAGRGPLPEYEKYKIRNFFILMRRHTNSLQWICFVILIPLKATFRIIKELYHGNSKVVLAQFRGFLDGFIKG
ncbi:MAG: glycosyltransferase family 2 protein [Ignavibacteriales bacterium]